jgi:L-ascorbate metabolism protein UlaG (beta-lactamase superfamily)
VRITQIGHASLLFETASLRILMDPVFVDPHQEGALEVFPRRALFLDRLPPYEIMVISHRHLDHFDIATLAQLSRDVHVIVPRDDVIVDVLRELDYPDIVSVAPHYSAEVDGVRLLLTPSNAPHAELGLIVSDADGTAWNQVDGIPTERETAEIVSGSPIDLLLAPWQPMLELEWQYNQPVTFPTGTYAQILRNIARVRPRAVGPASNGFRYVDAEWLNHVAFPQSRERFLDDVVSMIPALEGKAFPFDPGDVFEIHGGQTSWHRRSSEFVTSAERDPFALESTPATAQRPLRDPAKRPDADFRAAVDSFVERLFPDFVREHPALFAAHREWKVVYQLEVAFAGRSEYWTADFRGEDVRLVPGRSALASISCGIAASALAGLVDGTRSWDYAALAGNFYQHSRIYGVWSSGLVYPAGLEFANPLALVFPSEPAFLRMLDEGVSTWKPLVEQAAEAH